MLQCEVNSFKTTNQLNGYPGSRGVVQERHFSYFLKDNSGLSFLSGDTLSALGFSSLLCAGAELRFFGGIPVPSQCTKQTSRTSKNIGCLRGDKFSLLSLKPAARVPWQQYNNPNFLKPWSTVRSICITVARRGVPLTRVQQHLLVSNSQYLTAKSIAGGSPSLVIITSILALHSGSMYLFCVKTSLSGKPSAVYSQRDHVTKQKQTYPNSLVENAGKRLRNIRLLAFIWPFKALTMGPTYMLVIVGDTNLSVYQCTQTSAFINNTRMTSVVCHCRLQW